MSDAATVPLLDRELFFGNPEIAGAQLSPDGRYTAFLKPWQGTLNVWVKATGAPVAKARLLTAEPSRPIAAFFWSWDSKAVLFVRDKDGDENFNLYAVGPEDAPARGKGAPAPRRITYVAGARVHILSLPKADPDTCYVGLNDRDPAWHDLYRVSLSTGERTLLRENSEQIADWIFDLSGKLRLALRTSNQGDTEILRVEPEGFTKVYSCSVFESCDVVRFHKDGRRVYLESNRGDDADLTRLVLFDPETLEEEVVESDPEGRVDLGFAAFSIATDELVATVYQDQKKRTYYRDAATQADQEFLEEKLPGSDVSVTSATLDDQSWLVLASSDVDPGTLYRFDRRTRQLDREYLVRERLPREHMAELTPIEYRSSDELPIPAYLMLPKGAVPKRLPLVVLPHGGPNARDIWGFKNLPQFLANRGYAVLLPNFRGSTGYGKAFLNAGNAEWGDKMQDDLSAGVRYLVKAGTVEAERVGILGGSYGGYAVLAGLAFTPELYAAGVSIVGPSNLITLLESIPPYWEAGRILLYTRVGNPSTPEGRAKLERQSPLHSANRIRASLLVAQGANDPRVKKAESEQIVRALRDHDLPVEYLLAEDEGHGFARPMNNMAVFAAVERFLAKHLGGRFQEDAPEDVTARLAELRVDPALLV